MPPFKLAVVGAGPSAFYTVSRLLAHLPPSVDAAVHVYDRLPAPHGLVRFGVAPDHPEVKNCIHKFEQTAQDPRFRFFGNVLVSPVSPPLPAYRGAVQLPLSALLPHYSHLLLSYGSSLPMGLSSLPSAIPALDFVHWYTAHPSAISSPPLSLSSISDLTLIGHGNVSLDICRLLLRDPRSLAPFPDLPASVLSHLETSTIKHISIVGRRGPAQVSFTAKELRELMSLPDVAFEPIHPTLMATARTDDTLDRPKKRILDILANGSKVAFGKTEKTWSLRFLRSPVAWDPSAKALTLGINELSSSGQAESTGLQHVVQTGAVVTSVGYRSEPLAGAEDWFDDTTGKVRNVGGRVMDQLGRVVKNVYTSGWAATGARGVIAASMHSAYQTADNMLADLENHASVEAVGGPMPPEPATGLPQALQGADSRVVSYDDWRAVAKDMDIPAVPP